MIDVLWNSYMIWSEALIEDDFPKQFFADLSTDIVARLAVQQAEATYNIKAWPVKMIGDNWEQVPMFGNLWQLFKKRALFGLQHLISELADRFLKCSLGKCIEIWGVDTLCRSQLTKRRQFWWSFSWERPSFPPGSASTLFLLGSWSIQEGNRWVRGGESAGIAFCG